ncbi:hypothetical protein HPB51_026322 [Rhipicephalus microplus]|nr:hypothetical protein HPB51_026322 [Rhipicephalus microplus]
MQERLLFDDTVVILLSDHGARFGTARASETGRHEDKNPFGLIVLPQRLLRRYPTVAVNLERGCGDAFVSAHFCDCQGSHADLDKNLALVQSFAFFVVEHFNKRNEANFPGQCIK